MDAVSKWKEYADEAGVFADQRDRIQKTLRLTPLLKQKTVPQKVVS